MVTNAAKHFEMLQNMSLGSNGMDQVPSLQKIQMRLRCTNFCINCTSQPNLNRVSCSNEMVSNAPKHYKTHQNMSLGSNGGLGAFVAKKSEATSLYELLHFLDLLDLICIEFCAVTKWSKCTQTITKRTRT